MLADSFALDTVQDKRLLIKVNGNRSVTGILRGFDPFMCVSWR